MDFEPYLRTHLDPTNQAGRPLAEHVLSVTVVGDRLFARIHPHGFNAEESIFEVTTAALVAASPDAIANLRQQLAEDERQAARVRDAGLAEYVDAEGKRAEALAAQKAEADAKEGAKFRPADLSKQLPDGDPVREVAP